MQRPKFEISGHAKGFICYQSEGKCLESGMGIHRLVFFHSIASPGSADPKSCVIRQFITAKSVASFKPKEITDEFSEKDPWVFGLARLDCLKTRRGEAFQFRWLKDEKEILKSRAGLGSSRNWRIWSKVRARPGRWKIQLTSMKGRVIAERTFIVQGKPNNRDRSR